MKTALVSGEGPSTLCITLHTLCKNCREKREQVRTDVSTHECALLRVLDVGEDPSVCTAEKAIRLWKCCARGNHTRKKKKKKKAAGICRYDKTAWRNERIFLLGGGGMVSATLYTGEKTYVE